jgi:hypothetical protein
LPPTVYLILHVEQAFTEIFDCIVFKTGTPQVFHGTATVKIHVPGDFDALDSRWV